MNKLILILLICSLIFGPSLVLASPGQLDQYGGHQCLNNCSSYALQDGQYHYHDFPMSPNYLSGSFSKIASASYVFYQAQIGTNELTFKQASFLGNDLNELTKNTEIDARFCKDGMIFAQGLYDQYNRARVKPVCANVQSLVLANNDLDQNSYYKELPSPEKVIINVYHYIKNKEGKEVFTDHPDIAELKGLMVQGATDSVLYYINRYDEPLTLRSISVEKAKFYYGDNYASQILYFDDSIIYSYKIGQPLY